MCFLSYLESKWCYVFLCFPEYMNFHPSVVTFTVPSEILKQVKSVSN